MVVVAAFAASAAQDRRRPITATWREPVGRQRRQLIDSPVGPAVFDRDVLALDEARFAQALPECRHVRA